MFAFHVVLSRKLGLAQYGALYTLISIATFIAVLGGILTIVIARLIAEHRTETERLSLLCGSSLKQSAYIAAGALLVMLALSVPIAKFLRVADVTAVVFLAVFAGGQLALAGLRGVLQGLQQFPRLAASLIIEAFVRTGLAIALAVAGLGIAAAIGAYALGTIVAIGYCVYAVRRSTSLRFGGSASQRGAWRGSLSAPRCPPWLSLRWASWTCCWCVITSATPHPACMAPCPWPARWCTSRWDFFR